MSLPGNDTAFLDALLDGWRRACERDGKAHGLLATREADQQALWAVRKGLAEAQKREGLSIKHDIGLPISQIPQFMDEASVALENAYPGIRIVAFGHIGDGNLHYNLSYADPVANDALLAKSGEANAIVYDVVSRLGGSIAAEHGIGQLKTDWLEAHAPEGSIALMQKLKTLLDPKGLMNPGKVLGARK